MSLPPLWKTFSARWRTAASTSSGVPVVSSEGEMLPRSATTSPSTSKAP